MKKVFKLRFYFKSGANKGNFEKEEYFWSIEELNKRYNEVFKYNDFSLNPTAWKCNSNGLWERLAGY